MKHPYEKKKHSPFHPYIPTLRPIQRSKEPKALQLAYSESSSNLVMTSWIQELGNLDLMMHKVKIAV